jgi:hypothetical protein
MSKEDPVHENEIRHADPKEGFDRQEPQAGAIAGFAIGSVVLLIITIVALQAYFDKIWAEAVYEKVLAPPSEQLLQLHNREDWNLTHYGYSDKASGTVRIPVDRAMELFKQEASSGKLFYPAKNTVPKKEEPAAVVPEAAPGAPPAAAAPAPEKK